ncbi:MAG: SGNH/GDSL hydrolase family protein [Gemmatimonadetes bacterium]|nr:SGNH/GDSL hydrolase family protein [Gemmatimonadota bacterium]
MTSVAAPRFPRYVAIGDSSTEGLDDPDGRGGYRGWANRLAERLAAAQGSVLYANLGIRGRTTREIRDEQLARAVAMEPTLATLFSGTNDVVARRFDADRVAADVETMQRALVEAGATVLTFTLPDLTPVMPLARLIVRRVEALNTALRDASARSGAILVDVAKHPVASDPRLWSEDRLHANALGHARIAQALAHAIGLPDAGADWAAPLPAVERPGLGAVMAAEWRWTRRHLAPWIWRHLRGISSGDGVDAKRPALSEMVG